MPSQRQKALGTDMARPSTQSPIFRYGLVVIAAILWYAIAWDPISSRLAELSDAIDKAERSSRKLAIRIADLQGVDQEMRRATQQYEETKRAFLPGATPQAVGTALQDITLKKASEAGLEIITYRTGTGKDWRSYPIGNVTLTAKTSTRGLVSFLRKLEQERGVFRIDSLNVTKMTGRDPHLRVTITIEAISLEGARNG